MSKVNMYPIGKFEKPENFNKKSIRPFINDLEKFPGLLQMEIKNLKEEQLAAKTLPGVWSVAQVINHIADSHMNAFIRIKLTLTEDNPTIKPYKESLWANIVDGLETDIEPSLKIIEGVHKRLALTLNSLDDADLKRTYFHPEYKTDYILGQVVALYAWHGKHHLAFITGLIKEKNW
jgi:uncharacterized damage-inducible protein DinB